jgi:hypothetical protein
MVILRHSRNLEAFWGTEDLSCSCKFIEDGFSYFTDIAVPYFFIVSGFFFFRFNYYLKGMYKGMLKRKFWTLFIPFLFWNIFWAFVPYLSGQIDFSEPIINKICHLLFSDYNRALWYIANILIMMSLVPLYNWIFIIDNKYILATISFFLLYTWLPVDNSLFSTEGAFFFFIGGCLYKYNRILELRIPSIVLAICLLIWCLLAFYRPFWSIPTYKISIILGLVTFWQIICFFKESSIKFLLNISSCLFFIYVNHFWVIKGMKVMIASFFPCNEVVAIISYFILPMITFLLLYYIAQIWQYVSPLSYKVVVGNR